MGKPCRSKSTAHKPAGAFPGRRRRRRAWPLACFPAGVNRGLYSGVEAMSASERRLDAIALNLANLSVAGYKRRGTATEGFDTALRDKLERHVRTRYAVDFSQGTLSSTGEPYDLALAGPGFFAVETARGEGYSRNGRFHVDENGVLQTSEGFPVAWEGARGTIDPQGPELLVDPDGQVWQDGSQLGRLRLVDFASRAELVPDANGYLHAPARLAEVPHQAEVRQKSLEQANVSAVDEMIALISAQRSFESATRLMSMIERGYQRLTAR